MPVGSVLDLVVAFPSGPLLAQAASASDLLAARNQMALSLGWHIVLASFGVAFPTIIFAMHVRGIRGDDDALVLARRWSKVAGVLFAVGAVSGTILSFEMGMLWPGLMGPFGDVIGLPFALEGVAFFLEAIFLGIYLYGWDRLPPRVHVAALVPVMVAGVAGTFFILSVNSWMNTPTGFTMVDGVPTDVDPLAAMLNPALLTSFPHMLLAAYMVVGFSVAGVYATGWLRGRHDRLHHLGIVVPLLFAAVVSLAQPLVGHMAGQRIADEQPIKLAAIEGLPETTEGAALTIGGVWDGTEVRGGVEVPNLLSLLATNSLDGEVVGLDAVPVDEQPPVNVVRFSFMAMVGIGTALALLSTLVLVLLGRRRRLGDHRWLLGAVVVSGPAAVVALETGWITTEVGRQPWIVQGLVRTEDAVTTASWIWLSYGILASVYGLMTLATVLVLRSMSRRWRRGESPSAPYGPAEPLGSREQVGA